MNTGLLKALDDKYVYVDIDGTLAEYRFDDHVNAKDGTTNGQTMEEINNHIFLKSRPLSSVIKTLKRAKFKSLCICGAVISPVEVIDKYLDLDDWGRSIFGRKKPLAKNTMNRIARGLEKFVFNCPEPFIVQVNHGGNNFRGQSIYEPMPTITAKHGFGVVTPLMIQYHSETTKGSVRGQAITEPVQTIDTSNRYGLVMQYITKFYKSGSGQSILEPLHTITTSPGHFGQVTVVAMPAEELLKSVDQNITEQSDVNEMLQKCTWVSQFIMEYYGCGTGQSLFDPLHTVVTKDRFALVTVLGSEYVIMDIFLRMLKPEELKLGQGFPKDYIINRDYTGKPYPVAKQVARIGNSVAPGVARVLVAANCPYLKIGERMPNMSIVTDQSGQLRFA